MLFWTPPPQINKNRSVLHIAQSSYLTVYCNKKSWCLIPFLLQFTKYDYSTWDTLPRLMLLPRSKSLKLSLKKSTSVIQDKTPLAYLYTADTAQENKQQVIF